MPLAVGMVAKVIISVVMVVVEIATMVDEATAVATEVKVAVERSSNYDDDNPDSSGTK